MSRPKIRLHVEHPLSEGQTVDLSREHANYLFAVMRLGPGAEVALPESAGRVIFEGTSDEALANPVLLDAYLGASADE